MTNITDHAYEIACQLYAMNDWRVLEINNTVADSFLLWNRKVFNNQDPKTIEKLAAGNDAKELVARSIIFGKKYKRTDFFVRLDAYGFLVSSNDIFEIGISQEDMALFLANNQKIAELYDIEITKEE